MSPNSTSAPASEALPIVLANTISIGRGRVDDVFGNREGIARWMRDVGEHVTLSPHPSPGEPVTEDQAERLISLRDGIRRLAAEATRDPRTLGRSPVPTVAAATAIVNTISSLGRVWPEMHWCGATVVVRHAWGAGGTYADALTTTIAQRTVDLIAGSDWQQLRACLAPGCAYFFVKDNVRREWCTPSCGNRARVARYARRHRVELRGT